MVTEKDVIRKVTVRLIPFLGFIYLIAYIDRQNVSYAKLQMVNALGLSEYAYGLGASLFFIGYFLFEVPSNVLLERVGAARWFARIMVSWGLVTIGLAYTQNATMFYILRFLLGVCEASPAVRRLSMRPDGHGSTDEAEDASHAGLCNSTYHYAALMAGRAA